MKIAAGVILFSLSLASASWAQNKMAIEQLAAHNKPDREKILYEGAKSEGKITWYTSLAGNSYKELASAFESKYPGVKVESYRATRAEMSARIMAESQAQRYIVDTIETTIPLLKLLKDNSMLVPYYFPTQGKFPDHVKEKGPKGLVFWAIDRESHIGLAYNKNSIPAKLAPKNYQGLLRPELKDKIAFAGSDTGVTVIGAMLKFQGEEYVKKLRSQNPAIHNVSGRALLDMSPTVNPISCRIWRHKSTWSAGLPKSSIANSSHRVFLESRQLLVGQPKITRHRPGDRGAHANR